MTLQHVDASDAVHAHHRPKQALRDRILTVQAIFFVGLGLLATVAWIAFLAWLLFRVALLE